MTGAVRFAARDDAELYDSGGSHGVAFGTVGLVLYQRLQLAGGDLWGWPSESRLSVRGPLHSVSAFSEDFDLLHPDSGGHSMLRSHLHIAHMTSIEFTPTEQAGMIP